jgi:glutathionylspermidine synthase
MVKLKKVTPLSKEYLESLGFFWHTDKDESSYISDELVVLTEKEAEAYHNAANELYDMFVEAGDYIIKNNLFHEVGVPFNLVELVKLSWENDVHWHLYGRFDFAGGIDGKPIKLIEFNADTPTALFESAIIQWAILKQNNLEETAQFNYIYEALLDNFKRVVTLDQRDISEFDEVYQGWKFLFSSIRGNVEEENTVRLLEHIAKEAGYITDFAYVDEVGFDEDGIFLNDEKFEFWFKLIPWEDIALEEPDLAMLLTSIIKNQEAIIFNPAYTLMFQSKAILKILWDLFPNHPLLLETSFEPLKGKKQVKKPIFGREGGDIEILDAQGAVVEARKEGLYNKHKMVYQEYVEFPQDAKGRKYQAGVFFAYEGCGVGFRQGGEILDNMSKFAGHIVEQ